MRREDWVQRLHDFLEARWREPFAWGKNDCCLLVADAIAAMTDEDPAAEWRGAYADEDGAAALITKICGGSSAEELMAYVAKQKGWRELPSALFAQRGDVVSLESGALGLVHLSGHQAICFGQEDGRLHLAPLRRARRAWRVD